MSRTDLNAIPRIIDDCEGTGTWARANTVADTINHLMGATRPNEHVAASGSDLIIPPLVIARLLRAARGEHVELGRLVFAGNNAALRKQADDIADSARKLLDLCRAGSTLRQQVEAGLEAEKQRRQQVQVIADEISGGNIDEAQEHLAALLAGWEE